MKKDPFQPKSLILQWHITERCNWRCKHCYQERYNTPEMNLGKMEDVLNQYVALIKKWYLPRQAAKIQITGGEPFIREDFLQFLERVHEHSRFLNWTIMSNGSYLTRDIIKELKSLEINGFQVSIEGLEKTNDEIRGLGSFQKILKAIELLNQAKIIVKVSFTLTKKNYQEIKELAEILAPLNVKFLAVRRIAPFGLSGSQFKNFLLEPLELREVYRQIEEINRQMREKEYSLRVIGGCENAIFDDEISAPDLMGYERCAILDGRVIIVMPDGEALVCRRCPIKIGNLYEKSLEEIYYSQSYEFLRNKKDVPIECYLCSNFSNCLGGAKCVTYALTGKTAPDVQCWKLFKNLEEAVNYVKSPGIIKKILLSLKNLKRTV